MARICNRRVEAVTMEAEDAYWRVVRGHIHYDGDEKARETFVRYFSNTAKERVHLWIGRALFEGERK